MNLLRKLFGKKPQPTIKPQAPAPVPVVKEKPVISLDIIESTHDEPSLINLAISGETTQLRQAAANKIVSREALEQLVKQLKNKDKNVLKLVKAKLDVYKEADTLQAKRDSQGVALCEKCERHSHHEADAVFKAKLQLIEQEFNEIKDGLSDAIQQRFLEAKSRCDDKIRVQAEAIALEEERQAADQDALRLAQESLQNLNTITAGILNEESLSADAIKIAHVRIDELSQALRLAKQRDIDLSQIAPAFEKQKEQLTNYLNFIELHGTFTQVANSIDETREKAVKVFNQGAKIFPRQTLEESAVFTTAKEKVDAFSQKQKQEEDARQAQIKQVSELVRRGSWAVNNGQVRKARGILRDLTAVKETLTTTLPAHLESKLTDFELEIDKLGDWHEFAVTPKKQQLIEEMQALATSTLEPESLASRIHDLQDEWREVSRGGQQQDDHLWEEFQAASATAYAPCKDFFEAQARAREDNLEKRRQLIQTLSNYIENMDWASANWKDVEQTLKLARNEWQTYWPVSRKAGNDVAKEFEALMDQLHGKIKAEYDLNKQKKHTLVQEAKALTTQENLAEAAEKVKALQQDWKSIGRTWHREDQALWSQFREACDLIFNKRQSQYDQLRQESQTKLLEAKSIVAEIEKLADSVSSQEQKTNSALAEFQAQLASIELSKKDAATIDGLIKKAIAKIDAAEQSRRQEARNQARESLHELALAISALECSSASSAGEFDQTQRDELLAQVQTLNVVAPIKQALKSRLDNLASLTPEAIEQSTINLRLLCIRAEILREAESPTEDKAMRMNYQVELMQKGLGCNRDTFDDLEKEWWSTPAVSSSAYQALAQRFFN
ncbi:MAG: DUF349 domain-containing protein [Cellvibrio sp.]